MKIQHTILTYYDLDDLIEDLEDIIGNDFCENGVFSGQGIVYRQTPSGDIHREVASFTQLRSEGFDIFTVDGRNRLAITLESTNNQSSNDLLFIIPDKYHLNECVRRHTPDSML